MSRFIAGWITTSVLALAATTVQAQVYSYPEDAVIVRRGPYAGIPPGPSRGGYIDDEAYDDLVPPVEVVKMIRSLGFKPLGPAVQRRGVYTVSAINRQGEEGRVVVDARSGRITRFVPTRVANAEPGGQPTAAPTQAPKGNAGNARPLPDVANRTPPDRSPAQPAPAPAAPSETRAAGATPPVQAKTAEAKPAETRPAQAKPSVQLLPTQDMPPVQGLD